MELSLTIGIVILASLLSLFFSLLTYSLREFSRPKLAEVLGKRDGDKWFEPITEHTSDLAFLTAIGRQICNIVVFVVTFAGFEQTSHGAFARYVMTILVAGLIAIFCSITIPHAAARYASAQIVGYLAPVLDSIWKIFSPVTTLMHATDDLFRRALGATDAAPQAQIEEEILSAVEEGEKEGVVDEQERKMIESVIEFRGTTVGHIATSRPEIIALNVESTLDDVKGAVELSGHSRIPVYEGTLDHVVGILYARDLIKLLGEQVAAFSVREAMRPALYVPETMALLDLLTDFRLQKVHMAIVLDEYGGTSGIVTIEDILEELVGEISDEHETDEPAMLKKIDEHTAEADARIHIEQLNRMLGLSLPENEGFETLGGYLSTSMARIPEKGAVHEQGKVRFTVLEAEPNRVRRVKIEQTPQAGAN